MKVGAVAGLLRHRRASEHDAAIRQARTCYDHVAGRLGVGLTHALCVCGYVVLSETGGEVTESGATFFADFGVDLDMLRSRRRMFCRPCLDCTERRPHLGGAVGAALAQRCFDLDWLRRVRGSRALVVTPSGRRGFNGTFGLSL